MQDVPCCPSCGYPRPDRLGDFCSFCDAYGEEIWPEGRPEVGMDTTIPVQTAGYANAHLAIWIDDEHHKVRLAIRGVMGEVMYLNHDGVVRLIKELSLAAKVVD